LHIEPFRYYQYGSSLESGSCLPGLVGAVAASAFFGQLLGGAVPGSATTAIGPYDFGFDFGLGEVGVFQPCSFMFSAGEEGGTLTPSPYRSRRDADDRLGLFSSCGRQAEYVPSWRGFEEALGFTVRKNELYED
jgi:hypothetical protein